MSIKSKLDRLVAGVAVAFMLCPAWSNAQAAVIAFDPLVGANSAPYAGHVENGFTVTPTLGNWFEAHLFGNPTPDIYGGPIGSPSASTIRVTGGIFNFNGVDLSSNSASGTMYFIEGLIGGMGAYSFGGTIGNINTFNTIPSISSATIDDLRITLTPAQGVTSFNLDNINVSTVPLPATIWMFLSALSGLGFFGWFRRRSVSA